MRSNLEFNQLYTLLTSILGEAKTPFDGYLMQLQFPCPHCIEVDGDGERLKHNLEVNFTKQVFQCWKCVSGDNISMKGSLLSLIKKYGNKDHVNEYKRIIKSIKESGYYNLEFDTNVLSGGTPIIEKELDLPQTYKKFNISKNMSYSEVQATSYLRQRGITEDIINDYGIGFTSWESTNKIMSNRIILPSFDENGIMNYFVARDFTGKAKFKYMNPKIKKEDVIINENKINWDADITLCEGVFDSIVIPNSIPMLGKSLNSNFKLYWDLIGKSKANINIFLDADAKDSMVKMYHYLNHSNLKGRIRCIFVTNDYDPSLIYQVYGKRGIINCLRSAQKIEEEF